MVVVRVGRVGNRRDAEGQQKLPPTVSEVVSSSSGSTRTCKAPPLGKTAICISKWLGEVVVGENKGNSLQASCKILFLYLAG